MYPLADNCTALDIIERSIVCHPSLFLEAVESRVNEDARYGSDKTGAVKRSVDASMKAAMRAAQWISAEDETRFAHDMAAGIIALNIACKLQCLPPHIRTGAAVRTWETA